MLDHILLDDMFAEWGYVHIIHYLPHYTSYCLLHIGHTSYDSYVYIYIYMHIHVLGYMYMYIYVDIDIYIYMNIHMYNI